MCLQNGTLTTINRFSLEKVQTELKVIYTQDQSYSPVEQNSLTDVQHLGNNTYLQGNQRVPEIAVGRKLTHPTKRNSRTQE